MSEVTCAQQTFIKTNTAFQIFMFTLATVGIIVFVVAIFHGMLIHCQCLSRIPKPRRHGIQQRIQVMLLMERSTSPMACPCTICLDTTPNEWKSKTFCSHEFHKECLEKWLEKSLACPICRADQAELSKGV
jgi:hypothetical protein